jgi:hypothetical protein
MSVTILVWCSLPLSGPSSRLASTGGSTHFRGLRQKINLLVEHAGIELDPYKALPQDVAEALRRGETIRAIKFWRGATGASLREAKEFIEEVQPG